MQLSLVIKPLEELYQALVEKFCEIIVRSIKANGLAYVTLSGGSTPIPFLKILSQQNSLPWDLIHFYWADERCVPPDNSESNYAQAKNLLFDNISIIGANIHRIKGELDAVKAVREYIEDLKSHRSTNLEWPRMDFVLLGMGEDGHTASLFPGKGKIVFDNSPVVVTWANYQSRPAQRITLTPMVFNTSKNIAFLVTGKSKAKMVANILRMQCENEDLPVNWIKPLSGNITWFLDTCAAELFSELK